MLKIKNATLPFFTELIFSLGTSPVIGSHTNHYEVLSTNSSC